MSDVKTAKAPKAAKTGKPAAWRGENLKDVGVDKLIPEDGIKVLLQLKKTGATKASAGVSKRECVDGGCGPKGYTELTATQPPLIAVTDTVDGKKGKRFFYLTAKGRAVADKASK
jgi:hypothetical protein